MNYLFSETGLEKLVENIKGKRTLYAMDFDGALAPIVPSINAAQLKPNTEKLLAELSNEAEVLVCSGRKMRDLSSRINNTCNISLLANHGIENDVRDCSELQKYAERICLGWKEKLAEFIKDPKIAAFMQMEDKIYSLSLHYRRAKNSPYFYDELRRIIGTLLPSPRILHGDAVINLLPPGTPHKATTIHQIIRDADLENAVFVGTFTEEDSIHITPSKLTTIRVGFTPNSIAQFYLRDQNQVEDLLQLFIELL